LRGENDNQSELCEGGEGKEAYYTQTWGERKWFPIRRKGKGKTALTSGISSGDGSQRKGVIEYLLMGGEKGRDCSLVGTRTNEWTERTGGGKTKKKTKKALRGEKAVNLTRGGDVGEG